ncbi:MAG: MAPEG family protein [Pseudomonadota bacterium]
MSIEIWSIAALSLMMMALTLGQGTLVPLIQGLGWGMGSRDQMPDKTVLQARLDRTVANQIEAMAIYIPLMGLVIALDKTNSLTSIGAWCVITGRTAFIPLYLSGVFALRTVAFFIALAGSVIAGWTLIAG